MSLTLCLEEGHACWLQGEGTLREGTLQGLLSSKKMPQSRVPGGLAAESSLLWSSESKRTAVSGRCHPLLASGATGCLYKIGIRPIGEPSNTVFKGEKGIFRRVCLRQQDGAATKHVASAEECDCCWPDPVLLGSSVAFQRPQKITSWMLAAVCGFCSTDASKPVGLGYWY